MIGFPRLAPTSQPARCRGIRALTAGIALSLTAFALSGCITAWTTYDFQADGSGTRHSIAAVDKELVDFAQAASDDSGESANPDFFADLRNSPALPADAIVNDYEDLTTRRRGVEITFGFSGPGELSDLSANGAIPESEQVSMTRVGDLTTFTIHFNPEESNGTGTALTREEHTQLASIWQMLGFDVGYNVIVPGTLVDWGPKEIGSVMPVADGRSQVTWTLNNYAALTTTSELWVSWQS